MTRRVVPLAGRRAEESVRVEHRFTFERYDATYADGDGIDPKMPRGDGWSIVDWSDNGDELIILWRRCVFDGADLAPGGVS